MKQYVLSGCGTALVTPFKNGKVDYAAYAKLVERQIDAGVHFLVPLGTTGETPCLDDSEKYNILEQTLELADGKPVIAGVGTNSLSGTLKNMRLLEHADMYLIVVPYYNKPTQRGQYEYFKALASETDKPIVLYNVPGRTGVNMTAETALKLAPLNNIIAIKEASGNLEQICKIIDGQTPDNFSVISGNDDQTFDIMKAGGAGVISVASNLAPELVVEMVNALLEGRVDEAKVLNDRLMPLFKNCFVESNPIPVKAGLAALGLIRNELRLPLTESVPSTYELIEKTLKDLNITR